MLTPEIRGSGMSGFALLFAFGLTVLMVTRHVTGGHNCGFPFPKTLPFGSPQAIDSQESVWADFAAQNQVILGSSVERLAPQSYHELMDSCEGGFLGRAYRTTRKGPECLFVTQGGVQWPV